MIGQMFTSFFEQIFVKNDIELTLYKFLKKEKLKNLPDHTGIVFLQPLFGHPYVGFDFCYEF